MSHEVITVTPGLLRGAAQAAADGFFDNEIWVWMLRRDWQRRRLLPRHYRAMIRLIYMPRDAAWTTSDTLGTALWLPPGTQGVRRRERFAEAVSMLPEGLDCFGRALRWEKLIGEHHPRAPHWYLQTLSVRPSAQMHGVGSALIAPGLERADSDGLSAHLETQRFSNVPFYERFGFELSGEIRLPDSPPVWLMSRPPGGRGR